jgi:hypothetical protein
MGRSLDIFAWWFFWFFTILYFNKTQMAVSSSEWHPCLLATKANAEDHPSWDEATNGPYSQGFKEACQAEYDTLVKQEIAGMSLTDQKIDLLSLVPGFSQ